MKKKALSILLALSMVMSFMPAMTMTAFADDNHHFFHFDGKYGYFNYGDWDHYFDKDHNKYEFNWNKWLKNLKDDAKNDLVKFDAYYNTEALAVAKTNIDAVELSWTSEKDIADIVAQAKSDILEEVQKFANDAVDAGVFDATLDVPTQGVNDAVAQAKADITNAEKPADITKKVFGKDFKALKDAVAKEIYDKAVAEAGNLDNEAVKQAVVDAHKAYAAAKTYEELVNARNDAQRAVEKAVAPLKVSQVLNLSAAKSGSKYIKLSWNAVKGATSYTVYANKCGKKYKKVATVYGTSYKLKKIGKKRLSKHQNYKMYVVANNGVASRDVHFITANTKGKYANVKSIAAKSAVTITRTKANNASASYKMPKKKKHLKKNHGPAFTYATDNAYVATVDGNGNIYANHCGTANIYVREMGGKTVAVAVTVQ